MEQKTVTEKPYWGYVQTREFMELVADHVIKVTGNAWYGWPCEFQPAKKNYEKAIEC